MFERCLLCAAIIATLAACGSSSPVAPTPPPASSTPPPTPAPSAPPPVVVSVEASGFSPLEVEVTIGATVTFVNNDRVGHDIASGLDHNSPDCPEVDVVGFLVPGQRRETRIFEAAKTCRFHAHEQIGQAAFQGRIVVR